MQTHIIENDELLRPATSMVADGVEEAVPRKCGNELLGEQGQKDAADGGQVEVVQLEEEAELEGRAIAHELATSEDYNVVCEENDGACLDVRDGGLAGDELELVGGIADDLFEGFVEDGPQGEAKGTVERGDAILYPVRGLHCGSGERVTRSWRRKGSDSEKDSEMPRRREEKSRKNRRAEGDRPPG